MLDKRSQTCCFTGHRNIADSQRKLVEDRLEDTLRELINSGYIYFGDGGALGFDTLAAQVIIRLKVEYPQIKLIMVLPCKDQAEHWTQSDQAVYREILAKSDKVVYTSDRYSHDCMFKRNRHLVDGSSLCICYLNRNNGGTAYTVRYAVDKGLRVINIAE